MAAVNQTYVDNFTSKIKSELYKVVDKFVLLGNNGVDKSWAKDIQRLSSWLKILEQYDVTASYFSEAFIIEVSKEYNIYCKYNANCC